MFAVFKLSQLLNQLSDHIEIWTWSVFYGKIRSQVISGNHWGGQRDGRTHTDQTNRGASHNTSSLSVEGYTKPKAELEINIDVKYVGEDERTDG
jgi:hypothetical protein